MLPSAEFDRLSAPSLAGSVEVGLHSWGWLRSRPTRNGEEARLPPCSSGEGRSLSSSASRCWASGVSSFQLLGSSLATCPRHWKVALWSYSSCHV